jgi:hypothetical protein
MPDLPNFRVDFYAFAEACGCPLTVRQAGSLKLSRRTTVVIAPRQAGKSRSLAMVGLHRAFARPGQTTLIVSAGDDAAKRLLGLAASVATSSPLLSVPSVPKRFPAVRRRNGDPL